MTSITHAPQPITVDGIEYTLAKITLEDLEYLDNWVAGRMMRAARLSMEGDKLASAQRNEVLVAASEAALGASAFSSAGLSSLMSPVGASKFLRRLLVANHKDITDAQCFGWIMRKDTKELFMDALLATFTKAKDGEIAGSDPTNGGPSTKEPSSESSSQPESSQTK